MKLSEVVTLFSDLYEKHGDLELALNTESGFFYTGIDVEADTVKQTRQHKEQVFTGDYTTNSPTHLHVKVLNGY